ncbi:hypothetical protein RY831_01665 [Noviherbaspirillum sp. CPCC 100848]|uniref:Uncharacterized protein n=1 Tax=Noviherbaspirillum album TaxID=3080276 RepID=A0ABU6J2K2_9BURK|nr:hypothetical protein [Noviherbaspirillum sp. CPCC 100848]MEC4717845.1 hypothetical protein [Noviherbaspirillum sp. CPCC 100848]
MRQCIVFALSLLCVIPASAERIAQDECRQVAEKLRSELPMKISSHSTLESVECVPGKAKPKLVYKNRVLVEVKKPPPEVIEKIKAEQRQPWCTDPAQRRFLELVDISYAYYDASDRYLGALTHRIADCGK